MNPSETLKQQGGRKSYVHARISLINYINHTTLVLTLILFESERNILDFNLKDKANIKM